MRHTHAPIIAVEHVVHIEKNGRDHKIGARGLRAKRGAGRCGTTLTVVLDIMSCFLPKKVASERARGTSRYLCPRQVERGNSPKNTWCASRSLAIDLSWMIIRRLRLIRSRAILHLGLLGGARDKRADLPVDFQDSRSEQTTYRRLF